MQPVLYQRKVGDQFLPELPIVAAVLVFKYIYILADSPALPGYFSGSETREYALVLCIPIAVLATIEAICLVIQIPLQTERQTYLIHAPVPL
jgi:hypothetical protein